MANERQPRGAEANAIRYLRYGYVYRVLLTGIHLMRTVEADLRTLNQTRPLPCLDELIERKMPCPEHDALPHADLPLHEAEYERRLRALSADHGMMGAD